MLFIVFVIRISFKISYACCCCCCFVDDDDDDDDDNDVREVFLCRLVFYIYKGYLEDVRILETRMSGLGGLK